MQSHTLLSLSAGLHYVRTEHRLSLFRNTVSQVQHHCVRAGLLNGYQFANIQISKYPFPMAVCPKIVIPLNTQDQRVGT